MKKEYLAIAKNKVSYIEVGSWPDYIRLIFLIGKQCIIFNVHYKNIHFKKT